MISALRKAHAMIEFQRGLPNLKAAPGSRKSSTLRRLKGKRTYIITTSRMISGDESK